MCIGCDERDVHRRSIFEESRRKRYSGCFGVHAVPWSRRRGQKLLNVNLLDDIVADTAA